METLWGLAHALLNTGPIGKFDYWRHGTSGSKVTAALTATKVIFTKSTQHWPDPGLRGNPMLDYVRLQEDDQCQRG